MSISNSGGPVSVAGTPAARQHMLVLLIDVSPENWTAAGCPDMMALVEVALFYLNSFILGSPYRRAVIRLFGRGLR